MSKLNYIVVMLFLLMSCQSDNEGIPQAKEPQSVPFSLRTSIDEVTTRVDGTSWDAGDQIGVYLHDYGTPTYIWYSNLCFINNLSGPIGEFIPSSGAARFDDRHYKLVAYYPFTNTPSSTTLDVSDQSNITPFLVANSDFDADTYFPLNIVFRYVYAKVIFRVYPKSGDITDLQDFASIDVVSIPLEGDYELSSQTFTSTSNKSTLSLNNVVDLYDMPTSVIVGKKAEAIVIPSTLSQTQVLLNFGTYKYLVPIVDDAWDGGNCYIYNISIDPYNPEEMEVSTGELLDWVDGNPNNDPLVPV